MLPYLVIVVDKIDCVVLESEACDSHLFGEPYYLFLVDVVASFVPCRIFYVCQSVLLLVVHQNFQITRNLIVLEKAARLKS